MRDFRVMLFSHDGTPEGELSQAAGTLRSCVRTEELNGEHSLSITTDRHLEIGTRALTRHDDGRWREWVVDEAPETHDTGEHALGDYHLCWSLQYDLRTTYGAAHEVVASDRSSNNVIDALTGITRGSLLWNGMSDPDGMAVAPFVMEYGESGWDRISKTAKYCPVEFDADIGVISSRVAVRMVLMREHLGSKVATRRLEWGREMTGITRTPDPGPYACRMLPLGSGVEDEASDGYTTFNVPWTIKDEPAWADSETNTRHDAGTTYIRDMETEPLFRKRGLGGEYEYPMVAVSFSTDDTEELMALAKAEVLEHTRPGVSYSGKVTNFAKLGMDVDGIALGDEIQVVDYGFNHDAPLRIQERVLRIEVDELGIDDCSIEIGKFVPKLERTLSAVVETVGVDAVNANKGKLVLSDGAGSAVSKSSIEVVGDDYLIAPVESSFSDYGSAIADLQGQMSDLYSGGASSYGGDGIVHTIDGVEITPGSVIAFTTVRQTTQQQQQQQAAQTAANAVAWGANVATGGKKAGGSSGASSWGDTHNLRED